jgi:hypothetical protein
MFSEYQARDVSVGANSGPKQIAHLAVRDEIKMQIGY